MIETKALTKQFDDFKALDNAEIHVPKGSIYGLIGPNGAGKTTLIRHIAGLMQPTSGEVLVGKQPIWENTEAKRLLVHIPENLYFFPSASITDMMRFYRDTYPQFDMHRFNMLQQAFPLPLKAPIRKFSRGMQKQVFLWLGLCCRPTVVLLDEPVDGLDPVMRRTVWSLLLQDVAEYQTTIFVSSHNLRELEDVCDHVGIMNQGKLILERNLSDLQEDIVKLQIAFSGEIPPEMAQFNCLHQAQTGRVHELIIRGKQHEILTKANALCPLFADTLPLSLEEIFIYELGGADYAHILI